MRDIPVFHPLIRIAERLGIDLVIFGSAASRASLLHTIGRSPSNLFELAEHASDIDLAHTGGPELTERLRAEIEREVPLAPWLRWSIMDGSEWSSYQTQQEMNFEIPLRRIHLATNSFLSAPGERAIEQALEGHITFKVNEKFQDSARARYDTEFSAALVHLDAVLDIICLGIKVDDWNIEVTRSAIYSGIDRFHQFNENILELALRRVWYRFAALAMRLPTTIWERGGLLHFIMSPLVYDPSIRKSNSVFEEFHANLSCPFVVSAAVRNGGFRFDPLPKEAKIASSQDDAQAAFRSSTDQLANGGKRFDLAPGNKVLAALTNLEVRRGETPSERVVSALPQEFVHVSFVPGENASKHANEDLTAIAIGRGRLSSALLPVYATVSMGVHLDYQNKIHFYERPPHSYRSTIRLNFAGMLNEVESVDVFLVGKEPIHVK